MEDNLTGNDKEESFAALLDSYVPLAEKNLQVGDKVQGRIISIGKDTVFVDTNTKIDGLVDKAELLDEKGQLMVKDGDVLELFVVSLNDDEIRLSRALAGVGGLHLLREAYEKQMPVEGRIKETCKGGFIVEVLHRRAFCPISQVGLDFVENTADYVGESHRFLITKLEDKGKNIVLSRRVLLAREQEKSRQQFYKTLTQGTILEGKVTRVMPYGAFVELSSGVEGMAHVSELSWSKIRAPEALVKVGESIRVKVIGIEPGKKPGQLKISLSIKQLSEDPWNTASERYQAGQKIRGKVTRCAPFGAFVEIDPGIEGLVHISEMSYLKRVVKPEDIVSKGETVSVLIKEIDPASRRISLSIRDAEGDPWLEVPDKYAVGQSVQGLIEKKEKFGYFVNLTPGITGLLPRSNFRLSSKPALIEKLNAGDTITVVITQIDSAGHKITLAPADAGTEQNWQKYADDHQSPLGSLGEKLQRAITSKENPKS